MFRVISLDFPNDSSLNFRLATPCGILVIPFAASFSFTSSVMEFQSDDC